MERQIISPAELRRRTNQCANTMEVEEQILDALRLGTIYARAGSYRHTNKSVDPPVIKPARGRGIEAEVWSATLDDSDVVEMLLARGKVDFSTDAYRVEMADVGFDDAQVADVVARWGVPKTKKTFAQTGRPTAEWWSDFAVELVDLFYSTPKITERKPETLVADVLKRLAAAGHDSVSARSVRETVHSALARARGN